MIAIVNDEDRAQAGWWGKAIRRLRERQGLTQAQLADLIVSVGESVGDEDLTLHRSAVANWEKGRFKPAPRYRRHIARALAVDYDLLFTDPPAGYHPPALARKTAA